jgi:pimeloyl-ACP methyl ester carboxylesterase
MKRISDYVYVLSAVVLSVVSLFMIWSEPVQSQTQAEPGVGYTHADLIDPRGPGTADDQEVPMEWFYPVSDITGLPNATFKIADGTTIYGQHAMPGVVAGGSNLISGENPVIVFSHGSMGHGIQNYTWYRDLAAQGFIVAAPTHIRHSLIAIGRKQLDPTYQYDDFTETTLSRHRDMKFAIWITDALFGGKVQRDLTGDPYVITAGHSQGAMTALMTATGLSRTGPDGYAYNTEPKVDAVISISPSRYLTALGGWSENEIQFMLGSLTKPVLIISGRSDGITPAQFSNQVFNELTGTPFTERLDVKDAEHNATTDVLALDADVQASSAPSNVKDAVTGIIDQMCAGNTSHACVPVMHDLQTSVSLSFLARAIPG